jgi:predicted metal-binding protein
MNKFSPKIVVDCSVRELCPSPYPNHSKGCPNYGKRPTCPPRCPHLEEVYNLTSGFTIVYVSLDFVAHRQKMKSRHPKWTQRQIDCCLYWQGSLNKKLKDEVFQLMRNRFPSSYKASFCPEAMGVNVTATMKNIGIELEWPPQNIVYKVAIIGQRRGIEN